MSAFLTFEPMFQETYTVVLHYLKNNLIDVLDEFPWIGRLAWLQFLMYILAVISHTGGVLDKMAEGADLVQLSSDLSATLVLWQASFLYIQIQINRKLIKKLIMRLGAEWRTDDHLRPEMAVMKQKCATSMYSWISKFNMVVSCYTHLYFCLPLIYSTFKYFVLEDNAPLKTPFKLKVPFQYEDNFLLFLILFMIDYGVLYNTGFLIMTDLFLMNVSMSHLRTLFIILQDDLKRIAYSTDEINEETEIRSRLKEVIRKHGVLLELMTELSEAFGAIFLIHLMFLSGTICFFGFAARIHCSPESVKHLCASCLILVCIFTCCSYGQNLTDASLDIAYAAYEGPWYQMSHEYKICILLIMLRQVDAFKGAVPKGVPIQMSQKAYYIKSTSFTDISLQSFTKILNMTWSFLSLIDKVYEG